MASLLTVRLDKGAAPSLGFRLQGGKDFGTPLVIQKVNGGSPAERSGLVAGDSVIKINNTDVFNLRHKDAQDVIVRAGPSFEVTIQRGGSTWKPSVIPTGPVHAVSPVSPVTKTSLAASRQESIGAIGTGHNVSAKPFGPQVNGTVNGGPPRPPVNNQYNSPIKLYSDQSIAETLSAQTEVLSTGALGVNFKKNEKNYDATNSAVYRMLQEAEKEPRSETEPDAGVVTASLPGVQGLRHVIAPETKAPSSAPQLPPGQNICANCERLIVGVFVRIKDKNLHVECFKCATCGTSLKNVGYYNLNNKLYCDVHAKLAAISQSSGANLAPVTVPPGGRAPANAISSALSSHSFPSPSPLSPRTNLAQPFQPLDDQGANLSLQSLNLTDNKQNNSQINSTPLSFGNYLNKTGNYSPKSFSSVNAPSYNTLPKASPLSPIHSGPAPSYSPASSGRSVQSFVWPPPPEEPEAPTACPIYVPPQSHLHVKVKPEPEMDMAQFQAPKLSLCSEEVSTITNRSAFECVETISETLETQRLIEDVLRNRPPSPPPPEATPRHSLAEAPPPEELKRLTEFTPNTVECKLKSQVENSVPQKWESPLVQALRIDPDPFKQIPKKSSRGSLATALAIAPSEPFLPQVPLDRKFSLPEETEPYFPPEHQIEIEVKEPKPPKPDSQLVKALQTAPERPFTPAGVPPSKKKDPLEEFFKELPKPQQRLSMRDALTTASDRPYSPLITESVGVVKEKREDLEKPLKPPSFQKPKIQEPQAPKPFPVKFQIEEKDSRKTMEKQQTETVEEIIPEEQQGVLPIFTGFSCSFENKSEHSQFKVEMSTTPPVPTGRATPGVKVTRTGASSESVQEESRQTIIERQAEEVVQKRPLPLAAALHKPGLLPQYQKNLSENAEAELRMMEKMEAAKIRMEKVRPVIKVEDGDLNLPGKSFIPVPEDRPPSSSFSPRPRPLTPSMINKPAPALPYYQASLVAQECRAAGVNLLDPTSPAISRSPSPCPGGERPASPYGPNPPPRPKSPAQGPPPNPLTCGRPLPTPRDSRVEVAKKNLSSYIPQHRSKMELREDKRAEFEDRRIEDESRCEVRQEGDFSVAVAERSHLDHLEQMKKSQSLSVEEGGGVQVQRKRTVTEEFERTQKMVEIERSIVKNYPFKGSRDPVMVEGQGIVGLHVTNPQPIESPFLKSKSIAQPCQPQQIKHVPSPSSMAPLRHVPAPSGSAKPSQNVNKSNIPLPNAGSGGGRQAGAIGVAPKRGRGILNTSALTGSRIPLCGSCHSQIRGPFITALGKIWCPDHFVCATPQCRRPLQDLGFVEEHGQLYCEYCFEQYLAPPCSKCNAKIKGDCLKAIGKNYHPECFNCVYCGKLFSNSPFFLEDGSPYCEADWNELFTTKCFACGFPVEAGDRWVEALNNNYHSQCFNCTMCKKNLEGQSFFAKGGRPFCKNHAR